MNVLVVDEYEEAAALLVEVLGLYGHASNCVHTVSEAVRTLKATRCDAVLIDLHLPKGTAFELATAVRAAGTTSILLIGMGAAPNGSPCEAVFDYVMEKPLDFLQLRTVLGRDS
jgi:DNA-binding response OmpR family regulator